MESALSKFRRFNGLDEVDPIERLRFFCSQAMNGDDWLDLEQFIDAVIKDKENAIKSEREACALTCEELFWRKTPKGYSYRYNASDCSKAIRARSNKK